MPLANLSLPVVRVDRLSTLPVAIIGAGPIGLAAAANLVERGIDFELYESGASAATGVASWGHIRLFSPWKHLLDPAATRLLTAAGWVDEARQDRAPYGRELVEGYLAPLAALEPIAARLHTGVRVEAVSRLGMDRTRSAARADNPFVLRLRTADGVSSEVTARAVIDASGTSLHPNSLGSSGLDPLGLEGVADLVTGGLPDVLGTDRARFSGKRVVVIGAGHSAANTLIALGRLAHDEPSTAVTWVIRNATAARIFTGDDDALTARASLGTRVQALIGSGAITVVDSFELVRLGRSGGAAELTGNRPEGVTTLVADVIVNATGFRPELGMLREIRLDLDEIIEAPRRIAPLIDPNLHSCGTVEPHGFRELTHPEPNFYLAGMKSYGRAPTFLMLTGYEQVRSIAAHLAGDAAAAGLVRLELPSTGVCSTDAGGCC